MPAVHEAPRKVKSRIEPGGGLIFSYAPASLFSLKPSWATSTAGKTLLTPTPYSVKMAFLDAAVRLKLITDPNGFVRALAKASVRIGLPRHACVTETIQRIRQETRESDRKLNPELLPYRPNVALREMVHYQGNLRFAFDLVNCADIVQKLIRIAPAINYVSKRSSFIQYLSCEEQADLDSSFTALVEQSEDVVWGHQASLDDFGPGATFDVLSSFTKTPIKRDVHRIFVDTFVPLGVRNVGPGFVHYSVSPSAMI